MNFGKYRGTVVDNVDPQQIGRITVSIGVARFEWKGIALQPHFKRFVERLAQLRILRRVHVQIHKTRQQQTGYAHESIERLGFTKGALVLR